MLGQTCVFLFFTCFDAQLVECLRRDPSHQRTLFRKMKESCKQQAVCIHMSVSGRVSILANSSNDYGFHVRVNVFGGLQFHIRQPVHQRWGLFNALHHYELTSMRDANLRSHCQRHHSCWTEAGFINKFKVFKLYEKKHFRIRINM